MSKAVRVSDYLMRKDPKKYAKLLNKQAGEAEDKSAVIKELQDKEKLLLGEIGSLKAENEKLQFDNKDLTAKLKKAKKEK